MEKYIYDNFENALLEHRKMCPLVVLTEDGYVVSEKKFDRIANLPCEVEGDTIRLYCSSDMLKCIEVRKVEECDKCLRFNNCPYVSNNYRKNREKRFYGLHKGNGRVGL